MDLDTWPAMLRRLAELVGPDKALELARACGGLERTYIPREATGDHPWATVLGADAWAKVVAAFGGERVDLPRGSFVRLRKREILALAEEGLSHRQIALRCQVGERYVRRVLEGLHVTPESDPRQGRLF